LVLFVALSALVTALTTVGLLLWAGYHWSGLLDLETTAAADESDTKRAGLRPDGADSDSAEDDADEAPGRDDVLQDTETQLRGVIEVVDVGVTSGALQDVLRTHYAIADVKGQKVILMTTSRRCVPCAGVDDSLSHALMQQALRDVRLVRVDLEVFREELERLRIPTRLYPGFFMIGPDTRPVDAIHGGEWDEDVAENIAPVLGSFVRGQYTERRHAEWSPTTTSVPL